MMMITFSMFIIVIIDEHHFFLSEYQTTTTTKRRMFVWTGLFGCDYLDDNVIVDEEWWYDLTGITITMMMMMMMILIDFDQPRQILLNECNKTFLHSLYR